MQRPTVMIFFAINILHSTFPVSEIYIFIISIVLWRWELLSWKYLEWIIKQIFKGVIHLGLGKSLWPIYTKQNPITIANYCTLSHMPVNYRYHIIFHDKTFWIITAQEKNTIIPFLSLHCLFNDKLLWRRCTSA